MLNCVPQLGGGTVAAGRAGEGAHINGYKRRVGPLERKTDKWRREKGG